MAIGDLAGAVETFSAPIEDLIIALGQGIADAQRALDVASLQMQEALDSDPQTAQLGLQATWYQFPKVDVELKLAISMAQSTDPSPTPAPAPSPGIGRLIRPGLRLAAQPVSAAYQNHFSYDAQAASTISFTIAPVPPPRSSDGATFPARMSTDEVTTAALTSNATDANGKPANFVTTAGPGGAKQPDPGLRFDVLFNGTARTWYVLQYSPTQPAATPTVVAVDDATGGVRVISTAG